MADRTFVRDAIGRFAKVAGRRAAKKVGKGLKDAAAKEIDRIDAAAQEKLQELSDFQQQQKRLDKLREAEKQLALAQVEVDHAATDGENEDAERKFIKAKAARDKAAAALGRSEKRRRRK